MVTDHRCPLAGLLSLCILPKIIHKKKKQQQHKKRVLSAILSVYKILIGKNLSKMLKCVCKNLSIDLEDPLWVQRSLMLDFGEGLGHNIKWCSSERRMMEWGKNSSQHRFIDDGGVSQYFNMCIVRRKCIVGVHFCSPKYSFLWCPLQGSQFSTFLWGKKMHKMMSCT